MSEATSNRRIYREIAEKISEKIISGEYAAGVRLPAERELAESFDVSRSSIREALIALEISGFVDVKLGSGVYVRSMPHLERLSVGAGMRLNDFLPPSTAADSDSDSELTRNTKLHAKSGAKSSAKNKANQKSVAPDIQQVLLRRAKAAALEVNDIPPFELLEARLLVEPECAAAAAQNITSDQINELKRLHRQMLKTGVWGEEDYIFHALISQNCGNAALASACEHLWHLTLNSRLYQRLNKYIVTADVWSQNLAEHERIVAALANGDPIRARYAMQQHLVGIMARLREAHLD